LVTFFGRPIGSEEFFNRIAETLGIIIVRSPKERLRKMESYTIVKIGLPYVY
jgi:hypothetical protein